MHTLALSLLHSAQSFANTAHLLPAHCRQPASTNVRHSPGGYFNHMQESDVSYIPCSGLTGENLVTKSTVPELTVWYTGPTVLTIIGNSY